MATAVARAVFDGDDQVELKRQQAIVQLLHESCLPPQAVLDKIRFYSQTKVLTKDVVNEVQALCAENGMFPPSSPEVFDLITGLLPPPRESPSLSSRFEQEFERIELLGRGGFGEVWHVRSRVDLKEYAIKMVTYKYDVRKGPFDHPALREARHWASFTAPGVVHYHTSWVEVAGGASQVDQASGKLLDYPSRAEEDDEAMTARSEWTYAGDLDVSGITFAKTNSTWPSHGVKEDNLEVAATRRGSSCCTPPDKLRRATLFLQTELIRGGTLRTWIDRRNASCSDGEPAPVGWRARAAEDIFRQCVDTVAQLHSQGLVHRDIKPCNILLTEDGGVRLTDFGLATKDLLTLPGTMTHTRSAVFQSWTGEHTSGVGTPIYASPEQQEGGTYDHKVDIYALGMVLAELLYPVRTQMERAQMFDSLRAGQLPTMTEALHTEAADLTELMLRMLSYASQERPSAEEISVILHQRAVELAGTAAAQRPETPSTPGKPSDTDSDGSTEVGQDTDEDMLATSSDRPMEVRASRRTPSCRPHHVFFAGLEQDQRGRLR